MILRRGLASRSSQCTSHNASTDPANGPHGKKLCRHPPPRQSCSPTPRTWSSFSQKEKFDRHREFKRPCESVRGCPSRERNPPPAQKNWAGEVRASPRRSRGGGGAVRPAVRDGGPGCSCSLFSSLHVQVLHNLSELLEVDTSLFFSSLTKSTSSKMQNGKWTTYCYYSYEVLPMTFASCFPFAAAICPLPPLAVLE